MMTHLQCIKLVEYYKKLFNIKTIHIIVVEFWCCFHLLVILLLLVKPSPASLLKGTLFISLFCFFFHELQEWGLYCHQVRVSLLCCGRKGQYQYKCWHRIFFLSVNQCNVHEKIKRPSYFHGFACSVYQVKCKKRSFLSVILSAIYQIWLPWYENFYQDLIRFDYHGTKIFTKVFIYMFYIPTVQEFDTHPAQPNPKEINRNGCRSRIFWKHTTE